jgi:two-component system nitrate/nitrite response regulator NarL
MRIILCDPHAMFSDAFSCLLPMRGHEVIARPRSVSDFAALASLQSAGEPPADVVVSDINFPDIAGTVAVAKIRDIVPDVPIAILTGETGVSALRAALDAGADGVAIKTESVDEVERLLLRLASPLFTRLRRCGNPEKVWSRRARALANQSDRSSVDDLPTPREREVIRLLARGESTCRIAQLMGVGTATVRTHLQHLFNKFGVHSRLELVAFAMRSGLIEDPVRAQTV